MPRHRTHLFFPSCICCHRSVAYSSEWLRNFPYAGDARLERGFVSHMMWSYQMEELMDRMLRSCPLCGLVFRWQLCYTPNYDCNFGVVGNCCVYGRLFEALTACCVFDIAFQFFVGTFTRYPLDWCAQGPLDIDQLVGLAHIYRCCMRRRWNAKHYIVRGVTPKQSR